MDPLGRCELFDPANQRGPGKLTHRTQETSSSHRTHETPSAQRTQEISPIHRLHEASSALRAHEAPSIQRTHETPSIPRNEESSSVHGIHEAFSAQRTHGSSSIQHSEEGFLGIDLPKVGLLTQPKKTHGNSSPDFQKESAGQVICKRGHPADFVRSAKRGLFFSSRFKPPVSMIVPWGPKTPPSGDPKRCLKR